MWLVYSILTTLSWGFADLFYKKGNAPNDKSSHIKAVVMVGVVMGIHAFAYMIIKDVLFRTLPHNISPGLLHVHSVNGDRILWASIY